MKQDVDVFMIAIGDDHQAMAASTVPRVEKVLGLPVNLITEGDPFAVKLSLLEDAKRPVLFIDCDLLLLGWDWDAFDPTCFNAAPDMMHPSWPGTAAIRSLLPNPKLHTFNSGLWLAPPSCKPLFRFASELGNGPLRDIPYKLGDQTPLNVAIQQVSARTNTLPQKFNWQLHKKTRPDPPPPNGALGVHLVGGTFEGDTSSKRDRVLSYCKKHDPMKRNDLLLNWAKLQMPEDATWHDIGAGDGAVSRTLKKVLPRGKYTCFDPKPGGPGVFQQERGVLPTTPADFILFNFVLHHVGVEMYINRYIEEAFKLCTKALVIQEDLDDGTEETRKQLYNHDPAGFYLSAEEWLNKLSQFCDYSRISCRIHPETCSDTFSYHVPRALFVVYK